MSILRNVLPLTESDASSSSTMPIMLKTPRSGYIDMAAVASAEPAWQSPKRRGENCGIGAGLFAIIVGIVVILAVALGVGLGVGLKKDSSDSDKR